MTRARHWLPLLLLCAWTGACAASPAGASDAAAPDAVPASTLNVRVMYTAAAATAGAHLTATALALAPTLTPTSTPLTDLDFSDARAVSVMTTSSNGLLVVLELPGLSTDHGQYRARTGTGDFRCYRDAQYPERLFCYGPSHAGLRLVTFSLMPAGVEEDLFITRIVVPERTPSPGTIYPSTLAFYQSSPYCEVEPLYQPDLPQLTQFQDPSKEGCYAITCGSYDHSFTCGTENTCVHMPIPPCP